MGGINVSEMGVGITVEDGKGLSVGASGLAIQPGNSISVSSTGVEVRAETGKGLVVGTNGLAVKPGNGINLSNAGVGVTVEAGKGLTIGVNGLAVQPANGINVSDTGVGVRVNAERAMLVDRDGIGINYGSGLAVVENKLVVSPAMPSRVSNTYSISTSSATWKTICNCAWYDQNNFAEFLIVAEGSGFKQRFILALSFDGELNSNNRSYAISVSNAGTKPANQYAIQSVRIASSPGRGDTQIQAYMTSNASVTCTISYSPFSISKNIRMAGFSDAGAVTQRGLISVLSNGVIQG